MFLLLMVVCLYPVNGNHYLIETSDSQEEPGAEADYPEPGCIELKTDFAVSCVKYACVTFRFF